MEQPRNLKQQKGLIIAKENSIKQITDDTWRVQRQSNCSKYYTIKVTPDGPTCTCANWKSEKEKCKHIYAMEYLIKNGYEKLKEIDYPEIKRKTYSQDWNKYNHAQKIEKREFMKMLSNLLSNIREKEYEFGRPNIPVSDILYALIFKVYSGLSTRRFSSDIHHAKEMDYIYQEMSYNTLFKYIKDESLQPFLVDLVELTASPLRDIETDFAADSSGFGTSQFQRWFSYKHQKDKRMKKWVKCHIMTGVKTNIITAVRITTEFDADSPQFEALVKDTNEIFDMQEVSADKAYSSRENLKTVYDHNATPLIPFRSNTTGKARGSMAWSKAYHYFMAHYDEFMKKYHKRSNVETTFHMIKSKFRDRVRSKTWSAQVNEVLCKIICHNLCVLIQEIQSLNLNINLSAHDGGFQNELLA